MNSRQAEVINEMDFKVLTMQDRRMLCECLRTIIGQTASSAAAAVVRAEAVAASRKIVRFAGEMGTRYELSHTVLCHVGRVSLFGQLVERYREALEQEKSCNMPEHVGAENPATVLTLIRNAWKQNPLEEHGLEDA